MPRKPRIYLSCDRWPIEDRARWQAAFAEGDRFEGSGPGSHLAEGAPWSEMDIIDLKSEIDHGRTVSETASFFAGTWTRSA